MKTIVQKLKHQLLADKKKSALLGTLSIVLLVVVARLVFSDPNSAAAVPARAAAAPTVRPAPVPRIEPTIVNVAANPAAAAGKDDEDSMLKDCNRAAQRVVSVDGMPRSLQRDLFMTKAWPRYPIAAIEGEPRAGSGATDEFWSKFGTVLRDYRKTRNQEEAALSKELADLALQSTLSGPRPLAYISGHLVAEGESVSGFSVLRIEERRVILAKSGRTHELVMK